MIDILYVGLGGFFGAMARYLISTWAKRTWSTTFPIGTLLVNWVGAFCLGFISHFSGPITLLLGTGFLGAFTTFSTFKLEAIQLHLGKNWRVFLLYILLSYLGGLSLAFLGMSL
ncbi:fluoride efflux transporter CrcB [Pullulanibacillus sp. KACC 23026]|uniref:fluoride efflux transporter CrcB n=1 Tax=Pullulanibacillus sp. KACC 23026 TaxID=3028315 RepID=UPI0023B0CA65|nr:fluoride efflux transporter CrcB [Pullulanibacillus sp. KACC 23026]WEG13631.1 fluoride efflux transporter CrcB [Pullulanibacillus sp. KACC 23026]